MRQSLPPALRVVQRMMTSAVAPSPNPSRRPTRPRYGAIITVGVAFAVLQTCLIATFPLLDGPELRSRAQSAVVSALDFPLGFAQPLVTTITGSSGATAFFVGLGLTFLNGAFWAVVAIGAWRRMRSRE